MKFVPRHRLHDNRLFKAYQQRHFGVRLRAGRLITKQLCSEVPLLIAPTRTVERLRFVRPTPSYEQKKAQLIIKREHLFVSLHYLHLEVTCNFDVSLCGFEQGTDDRFDWTRHKGKTPSPGTGTSFDHTTGDMTGEL